MDGSIIFIALVFLGFGLFARKIDNTSLTPPLLFAGLGLLLGAGGLGFVHVSLDHKAVHLLAEVTLILVLFSDAARINLKQLKKDHNLPIRILFPGMPLTIILGAVFAVLLLPTLSIWEAALLAAILAPTDAALGQVVVSSPRVPVRIRQALNVESGLNDGIALPLVMIFAACAGADQSSDGWSFLTFGLKQVLLGPLAGILIGGLGAKLVDLSSGKGWLNESSEGIIALAVAGLSFLCAEAVHGNGFISAFVAGMVFGNVLKQPCKFLFEFAETEGQLLTLSTFFFFGGVMLPHVLPRLDMNILLYALLSLTVIRMVPVWLSLLGTGVRTHTSLFLGWFGPRGLASILFGLLIMEQSGIKGADLIFAVILITVSFSILAHGVSAAPLAKVYEGMARKMGDCEEKKDVHEHPTRTGM